MLNKKAFAFLLIFGLQALVSGVFSMDVQWNPKTADSEFLSARPQGALVSNRMKELEVFFKELWNAVTEGSPDIVRETIVTSAEDLSDLQIRQLIVRVLILALREGKGLAFIKAIVEASEERGFQLAKFKPTYKLIPAPAKPMPPLSIMRQELDFFYQDDTLLFRSSFDSFVSNECRIETTVVSIHAGAPECCITFLHAAVAHASLEVLGFLLEQAGVPELLYELDADSLSPLMWAWAEGISSSSLAALEYSERMGESVLQLMPCENDYSSSFFQESYYSVLLSPKITALLTEKAFSFSPMEFKVIARNAGARFVASEIAQCGTFCAEENAYTAYVRAHPTHFVEQGEEEALAFVRAVFAQLEQREEAEEEGESHDFPPQI